jgi:drug/metabolite transporter (DMT)-like permease
MQKLGLGKANTFTNLIPVITAVFSFIILKETFPVYKILGTLIVIIGIGLVQHTAKSQNEQSALQ